MSSSLFNFVTCLYPKTIIKAKPFAKDVHSFTSQITQCTCLTGAGRSAIAVISLRGQDAQKILQSCCQLASERPVSVGKVRLGHWIGPNATRTDAKPPLSQPNETVVITAISEDHLEIHCHGGSAAIERILADLQTSGAKRVAKIPTESPLIIAEAEEVLSRCLTEKTAAVALSQVRGALRDWALRWLSQPISDDRHMMAKSEAANILWSAAWTMRLTEPWKIVLAGKPNVGKSSLLNALVGFERSITLDQAGTTRDVLHTETVIAGVPVRLSDTAGIRDSGEAIEAEGIRRALNAARAADLVVQIDDATCREAADFPSFLPSIPQIRVLNKVDLVENEEVRAGYDVATSANTGAGIELLVKRLGQELNKHGPTAGDPVVLNERQHDLIAQIADSSPGFPLVTTLRSLIGGTLQ